MNQLIATIIYVAGIIGLFYLDRDPKVRTSKALWIPLLWLFIVGSRPVSAWLRSGSSISLEQSYEEGNPINAAFFGLLTAAGVLVLILRSRQVGRFLRANLPLLLFFFYCALSIVWSDYPFISLKRWIKAVGDVVMVLIVLTDSSPLVAVRRFFSRPAFVLLPLSVLFNKYYPSLGRGFSKDWGQMYNGVTETKNELGMICLVCGLVSLWSLIAAYRDREMPRRSRHLSARGIVVILAAWLCVVANSMTSLSCLLMAGAVIAMTTQRWILRKPDRINILVGVMVALSLFALFADTSGFLVHALGRKENLTGRTNIWTAVLSMHTNPWIGTGFEDFWMGSRLERVGELTAPGIQEAHNGYIELYLNLGWTGLILLGVVMVSGYGNALATFRRNPHAGSLRLALFTAVVIYSLTEAGFRFMSPIWLAFLLSVTAVPQKLRSPVRPLQRKHPAILETEVSEAQLAQLEVS